MKAPEPVAFYAGGFLFDPATRSVLVHLRDAHAKHNPNKWALFGGLSEGTETPKECFIREMREELGLELQEDGVKLLCDYFNEKFNTYRYVFYVEKFIPKNQLVLGEGAGFDWIPLSKLDAYDLTDPARRDLKLFEKRVG